MQTRHPEVWLTFRKCKPDIQKFGLHFANANQTSRSLAYISQMQTRHPEVWLTFRKCKPDIQKFGLHFANANQTSRSLAYISQMQTRHPEVRLTFRNANQTSRSLVYDTHFSALIQPDRLLSGSPSEHQRDARPAASCRALRSSSPIRDTPLLPTQPGVPIPPFDPFPRLL